MVFLHAHHSTLAFVSAFNNMRKLIQSTITIFKGQDITTPRGHDLGPTKGDLGMRDQTLETTFWLYVIGPYLLSSLYFLVTG